MATQSHFRYVSFCLFCTKTRIQVQRGRKRKSSQTGCRESTPRPPFICSRQDAHYFSSPPHPQFLQAKTHTQEALTVSISPFIFLLLHNSFPHMVVEESASPQATNNFSALPSLPSPAAWRPVGGTSVALRAVYGWLRHRTEHSQSRPRCATAWPPARNTRAHQSPCPVAGEVVPLWPRQCRIQGRLQIQVSGCSQ